MIKKLEHFLFILLIFSTPLQFGKHFWPSWAYVSGIRVDYLSPVIYVSDILIVLLFLVVTIRIVNNKKVLWSYVLHDFFVKASIIIMLLLSAQAAISKSYAELHGILKLAEFLFLGRYIAISFYHISKVWFMRALQIGVVWVSVLAIWQFALQRSVGGFFYFLGERTFYASTPGIALMNLSGGQIVRPYAAFPHPNVLAFFLFFSLTLIMSCPVSHERIKRLVYFGTIILGTVALALTFSRVVIICYVVWLLFVFSNRVKSAKRVIAFSIVISAGILFFLSGRFSNFSLLRDAGFRTDLSQIAWKIFFQNPLFGAGLNTFFSQEIHYQKSITPTLLQPVHNIYLLVLAQNGIAGIGIFSAFLYKTCKRLLNLGKQSYAKSLYPSLVFLFFASLVTGLFDHYLLTLQQGQLLFTIILGLCWAQKKESL